MAWQQMPADAGQIVDVRYDCDWEHRILHRRTEDRSTGSVQLAMGHIADGEDRYEPQNNVLPAIRRWAEYTGGE